MDKGKVEDKESEFPAINFLREVIRAEGEKREKDTEELRDEINRKAKRDVEKLIQELRDESNSKEKIDAWKFIRELHGEREKLGWNHFTVMFEGGEELYIDNHGGGIRISDKEQTGYVTIEEDFMAINILSDKEVVAYGSVSVGT